MRESCGGSLVFSFRDTVNAGDALGGRRCGARLAAAGHGAARAERDVATAVRQQHRFAFSGFRLVSRESRVSNFSDTVTIERVLKSHFDRARPFSSSKIVTHPCTLSLHPPLKRCTKFRKPGDRSRPPDETEDRVRALAAETAASRFGVRLDTSICPVY